jgi:Permease family
MTERPRRLTHSLLFHCSSHSIGIISLTKVAARDAGYACGMWMFVYGLLGKVGAFFTSIPQPVLGGMSSTYCNGTYEVLCSPSYCLCACVSARSSCTTVLSCVRYCSISVCQHYLFRHQGDDVVWYLSSVSFHHGRVVGLWNWVSPVPCTTYCL